MIECIANFSEGRDAAVITAIQDAIADVPGVLVLDRHSDADHNRTVITFAGEAKAVAEGAFRGVQQAVASIDLNHHTGTHPRIGAADVVPFVPLAGSTLEECAEIARQVGGRIGTELEIPVYLYEAAATRPERRNLADVRRGEYESLRETIAADPAHAPDYGPARLGPAGAVAVGARGPLVAYNIYLTTDNVEIAQKIALAIRGSAGGLRYVKALGMLVDGKAQVSMNLTDFTQTPLHQVVEMVKREAAHYGVMVEKSELVGLIPQQALIDAALWYLQLPPETASHILEARLAAAER